MSHPKLMCHLTISLRTRMEINDLGIWFNVKYHHLELIVLFK